MITCTTLHDFMPGILRCIALGAYYSLVCAGRDTEGYSSNKSCDVIFVSVLFTFISEKHCLNDYILVKVHGYKSSDSDLFPRSKTGSGQSSTVIIHPH